MNIQQLRSDFLTKEVVLQLYRDTPLADYKTRIATLEKHANPLKSTYDAEVYEVKMNDHIGFFYFEAKKYSLAIEHFSKVLEIMKPEDYPFLYFHVLGLLIRCNRLIKNYDEAVLWFETGVSTIEKVDSSFEKLNLLQEYVDLLLDARKIFNQEYNWIIQSIIDDLGFPETLSEPVQTIQSMRERNRIWNRNLGKIKLLGRDNKTLMLIKMEEYYQNCEIQWYKNYAADRIAELKAKI